MRCGLIFCHCIVKAIEYTGLIPRLLPPFGLYEKQEKQSGNEAVNTWEFENEVTEVWE